VGSDWAQCSQLEQCYHVCMQQGFLCVFTDSVNSTVDKKRLSVNSTVGKKRLSVNSTVDKKRLFCTYNVRVGRVE
jgi:hypothetical protein